MKQAACQGQPTSVFFPEEQGNTSENIWHDARKLCYNCTVRHKCLALAMSFETPELRRHGMWGGLTPDERDTLHNRMFL